jgi:RNA polymerase sigma factor (TIGR02999 family)
MQPEQDLTRLLLSWRDGDQAALEKLLPLIYAELRKLAKGYLQHEKRGHTLQPTALVHEAYLRLVAQSQPDWKSRSHFYGVAAHVMRQILVDHARHHAAAKRDWGRKVSGSHIIASGGGRSADLIALDDALIELEELDGRKSKVIELLFFAGMTVEETAEALTISVATVRRDRRMAEAWLYRKLNG